MVPWPICYCSQLLIAKIYAFLEIGNTISNLFGGGSKTPETVELKEEVILLFMLCVLIVLG